MSSFEMNIVGASTQAPWYQWCVVAFIFKWFTSQNFQPYALIHLLTSWS